MAGSPATQPGILPDMTQVRSVTTAELSGVELEALRRLLFGAFGGRFEEHDWEHTLGGVHVRAVRDDDQVVAHGAGGPGRVSTAGGGGAPRAGGGGGGVAPLGMREGGRVVEGEYELGALADGSGIPGFYQRLGWGTWQGPAFVAGAAGRARAGAGGGRRL